jgi:hypothetical protein
LLQSEGSRNNSRRNSASASRRNSVEDSSKTVILSHEIPPLLVSTLNELIDCSDDMAETLSSLIIPNHGKISENEKKNGEKDNRVDSDMANHIFLIPELRVNDESIKKYLDFSKVGRAVLGSLKHYE